LSICERAFPNQEEKGEQLSTVLLSRILDTYVDIDAPPQRVLEVLLDFPAWEEWNPFIPYVNGKLEVGAHLDQSSVPNKMKIGNCRR
jgi:hypothetical protein